MTDVPDQKCSKCGKVISDDEYVVNWTYCSDCLTASYEEYLLNNPYVPDNVTGAEFDG